MGHKIERPHPRVGTGILFITAGIVACGISAATTPTQVDRVNWWSLGGATLIALGLVWVVVAIIVRIAIWVARPFRGPARNAYFTKIRGVTQFREAVAKARVGDELLFRMECKRDGQIKGVAIHLGRTGEQLGRFSRDRFPGVADQMLRGAVMTARVKDITGGGLKETGINIEVRIVRPGQGPHSEANLSKFALGNV